MIKPPSLQTDYTFISAGDPALQWPEVDENAPADEAAAQVKERERAITTARDTGQYPIREGMTPVTYRLRQIKGTTFDWFQGHIKREQLGELESHALLMRLGLVEVDGLGKVSVGTPAKIAGHIVAPEDIVDVLYEKVGRAVVMEIAAHLFGRATTPLPSKSR